MIITKVVVYILKTHKAECSKARLIKLLYLADWHQAITFGNPITNLNWKFENCGPYSEEIIQELNNNSNLFQDEGNHYSVSINNEESFNLPEAIIHSLNHVLNETKDLTFSELITLVLSTYPCMTTSRFEKLDLKQGAIKYRQLTW